MLGMKSFNTFHITLTELRATTLYNKTELCWQKQHKLKLWKEKVFCVTALKRKQKKAEGLEKVAYSKSAYCNVSSLVLSV